MQYTRTIAANTLSQVIGKVISAASTFFISLLLARTYGPEGYGNFIKITTFVTIWYLFADFGLNAVYIRDSTLGGNTSVRWQSLFTLRLIMSLFLVFLALSVLVFVPTGAADGYTRAVKAGILLFAPTVIIQAFITSANAVFQEKFRYDLAAMASASGSLLALITVWVMTRTLLPGIAIHASVLALLAGSGLTAVLSLWFARSRVGGFFSAEWGNMVRLFKSGIPLGMTLLFNVIYSRADSIILTLFRGTDEVGIYGLAYKIFEFPLAIPTFFMNAVYPVILLRIGQGQEGIRPASGIIRKAASVLIITSVVVMILVWQAVPNLIRIRPEFGDGAMPLRILASGLPVFFLTSLTMWLLVIRRKHAALMAIYGGTMTGNIAANLLLIPEYGYRAASWITVLSECFILAASAYVLWHDLKVGRGKERGSV